MIVLAKTLAYVVKTTKIITKSNKLYFALQIALVWPCIAILGLG